MTHLIVATHGKFSQEIVNSAAMVYGEDENTHVVTFLPGEGSDDLLVKYNAILQKLPSDEPVLFLVDLFGGSPYNAAARVVSERSNSDIVTGISLPMLLEVLDAKDGSSLEELVNAAKEVGVAAIKSFHHKTEDIPKIGPKLTAPAVEANDLYDSNLSGNMNISLLRIDSRLIHGQVMTSWAKAVKCDAIFAINDGVAEDDIRRELLLQIVPPHLKGYVITVDKAIKVWHNPKYARKNIIWIVTNPADIVRLINGGVKISEVNVGGMTYREGDKLISQAVAVNKDDVAAFQKLLDLGVLMSLQQVASSKKEVLDQKRIDEIQF